MRLYKAAAAGEVVLSVPVAGTSVLVMRGRCGNGRGLLPAARRLRPGWASSRRGSSRPIDTSGRKRGGLRRAGPACRAAAPGPMQNAVRRLLAEQRTVGVIATAPRWQFFPKVFAGMDHQHAPQSIWIRVDRATTCTVCGSHPTAPLDAQAGGLTSSRSSAGHRDPQPESCLRA